MSIFQYLKNLPPDANFGMLAKANADTDPKKVDLCIGAYKNEDGRPTLLRAVKMAKQQMAADEQEMEEYLPLQGHEKFAREACDLLFLAEDNKETYEKQRERIFSFHSGSATNSIYMAMVVCKDNVPYVKKAYASDPCWSNYGRLATTAGLEYGVYPYFSSVEKGVDFEEMLAAFRTYEKGSIIIMQACSHNPTGFDLTPEQWVRARDVLIERELIPLLDIAYQGLGTGDLKQDSIATRIFLEKDIDFFVAQSLSKNMRLYSARVGVLHCVSFGDELDIKIVQVCKSEYIKNKHVLVRNLTLLSRGRSGSPTRHGAEIAYRLLSQPSLNKIWMEELQIMATRLINIRRELRQRLEEKKVKGRWNHLTEQIGMFAYLGISSKDVDRLRTEYHIYMMQDARISVSGLNASNMEYFVDALCSVLGQQQ